jgi:prepilin-type N-terminal cleavage/methylation domain-containing protein
MTGDEANTRGVYPAATRRGFTLVEMLVVVSIFITASVAIVATSVNLTRLHRRAANGERLGEDLRYTMELLVRLTRNRRIVYPTLPGTLPAKTSQLTLLDTNGVSLTVKLFPKSNSACGGLNANCLAIDPGTGVYTALSGKNVNMSRFDVYVQPTSDPFQLSGGAYVSNLQPRVTFVVDANYVTTSTKEAASLGVQTTVSSRVYVR